VHLGQPVDVRVAPHPDEQFRATVSSISPTLDSRTRTLRVKGLLANAEGRLRPGTFARVDLGVAERASVAMLPEEAVLQRSDGSVVFRLVGTDRVERLRVRTGLHRDGWVEVSEPVAVGDRVIVRGQVGLVDGARVSVRTADGAEVAIEGTDAEASP
jgi:RND family efflux transporter MFP subunit